MTKRRATIDPSDVRHPSAALDLAMQGKRVSPDRSQLVYIHDCYWELKRNMDALMNRTDGWLRIVPKPDEDRIYLKWKYTDTAHEHTYVMAVVTTVQLPEGLMLLVHKLLQVEQGLLKPTRDKLYSEED